MYLNHQQKICANSRRSFKYTLKYIHLKLLFHYIEGNFFCKIYPISTAGSTLSLAIKSSYLGDKLHTPESHPISFTCASTSVSWTQLLHRPRSVAFCMIMSQLPSQTMKCVVPTVLRGYKALQYC